MKQNKKRKGFTLLEILLVIAAIGILAAIVLVAINPTRQIAQVRDAQRRSDINTIYKALEQYLIDNQAYPAGITEASQAICNNTVTTSCVDLGVLIPTYISSIPKDPSGGVYKVYINPENNRIGVESPGVESGQSLAVNPISTPTPTVTATGGNITTINENGIWYKVHTFTTDGTFTVTNGGDVDVLLVGGGGGGGSGTGGGGGAGGVIETQWDVSVSTYAITIGQGGAGGAGGPPHFVTSGNRGTNGTNTTLGSLLTAYGGGGGGAWGFHNGLNGASGGGGGGKENGGGSPGLALSLDPSQGYDGGTGGTGANGNFGGGGGGGAGEVGYVPIEWQGAAAGGNGIQSDITGVSTYYAGGGGGGAREKDTGWLVQGGNGGFGGGGRGGDSQNFGTPVQAGNANTGGGGGGGSMNTWTPNSGAAGGSGIVIIRYPIPTPIPTPTPTIVTNGRVLDLDAGNISSYPGTGTTWTDLSGSGKTGTLVNSPTYNPDNGGSLVFNGENWVTIANSFSSPSIPTGSSDRTIVACFKPLSISGGYNHIMHYGNTASEQSYGITTYGGFISTHTWGGAAQFSNYPAVVNSIYCVTLTYNNTRSPRNIFFVNGSFGTTTYGQGKNGDYVINTGTGNGLIVGTRITGGEAYNGNIYRIIIYDRVLTDTEIQQNYNALKGKFGL